MAQSASEYFNEVMANNFLDTYNISYKRNILLEIFNRLFLFKFQVIERGKVCLNSDRIKTAVNKVS